MEEVFLEFEDEEVLAIDDIGFKISQVLANRVSNFISDNEQVKRFIRYLEREELEDEYNDEDYSDTEATLDSDDEYTLAMDFYEPMVNEIDNLIEDPETSFVEKCCLLSAMGQSTETDNSIIKS